MINIFILNETFTNGFSYHILYIISMLSILSAILVIISKNPIVSVLFLIGLFLNIAGYLMVLGINFIGLSYLLVYVGAVSILFLFILMLINVRVSELITDNTNGVPLAIMIGIFFSIVVNDLFPSSFDILSTTVVNISNNYHIYTYNFTFYSFISRPFIEVTNLVYKILNYDLNLYFVTSQIWDGSLVESSHITSIGNVIYTIYPMWLILTSIILLLAMVGSIVITMKKG